MKKKFIIPMIAVAAISGAVLFSAFKANSSSLATNQFWFEYDGSGDPTLASSYQLVGSTAPGCEGSSEVCAIRAEEGATPGQPNINSMLIEQIEAALENPSVSQPDVSLRN
ncbi:hypothetical protein [Pedobacter glucosidilyticus]|uniref:hypothetical protein n=1 Tax=Pedobacter glucosidilyticus TaxID=1122941 RepID=UPI0026EB6490|nr:hypothetical protein [Pedobacter glucosidilyticus]